MQTSQTAPEAAGSNALLTLLDLAHRCRHVEATVELDFLAVNGTHALAPYRQAALWFEDGGVQALSGVVQIEANAPYVQWLGPVCEALALDLEAPGPVDLDALPAALRADWAEWLPAHALWVPLVVGERRGGILLARELPWIGHELAILREWGDVLAHAYHARRARAGWSLGVFGAALRRRGRHERAAGLPWWRKRAWQALAVAMLVSCIPVRLTILAPGELVPANPAAIRAPLDGVIAQFHVKPNAIVTAGQPLFDFDQAELESRALVGQQALNTAEAEYRQALQQALSDGKGKAMLATLQGKIEERRAEAQFLRGQFDRGKVVAPRAGIALFDDPSEWSGRPVATGERIMRIAAPGDVEMEIWLGVADAIALPAGAPASLYLSADPLDPVTAKVRYMAYEAVARPDGTFAYRVRAVLDAATLQRVGAKGTAKLSGRWVPMAYWVLRRPLVAARQFLGV
jgi:multidrug efflux pump subunit AcrA (membrane-fusion protein)